MGNKSFKEISQTEFFRSVFRSLIAVEALVIAFIAYESRDRPWVLWIGVLLAAWNYTAYFACRFTNVNLYFFSLPTSLFIICLFNFLSPREVSFSVCLVPVACYSLVVFDNVTPKVFLIIAFILCMMWSETIKGGEMRSIMLSAISAFAFCLLFYQSVSYVKTMQANLADQRNRLANSEARLLTLLENNNRQIWSIDRDYRYTFGNSNFRHIVKQVTGIDILPGHTIFDIQDEKTAKQWKRYYDKALAGEAFSRVVDVETAERKFNMEYAFAPIVFNGLVTGVTVFGKDVTGRLHRNRSIRENEQLLNNIILNMPVGFQLFDKHGYSVRANDAQKKLIGLDALGKNTTFNVLTDPLMEKTGQLQHFRKVYNEGTVEHYESQIDFSQDPRWAASGKNIYLELIIFPLLDEHHKTKAVVLLTNDVSARKHAEMELIAQNKKLETFAFTTSHIIRRPLANLMSLTNLLDMEKIPDEENRQLIALVKNSALEVDRIIHDLSRNIHTETNTLT